MILREAPGDYGAEEEQIDYRGDERQHELEDKDIGQSNQAERAVFRPEQRAAVLPEGLQRAEGPAESLADQDGGRFRGFGPGNGFLFIVDVPAEAPDGDGEVGVLGYGIRGDASGG